MGRISFRCNNTDWTAKEDGLAGPEIVTRDMTMKARGRNTSRALV